MCVCARARVERVGVERWSNVAIEVCIKIYPVQILFISTDRTQERTYNFVETNVFVTSFRADDEKYLTYRFRSKYLNKQDLLFCTQSDN